MKKLIIKLFLVIFIILGGFILSKNNNKIMEKETANKIENNINKDFILLFNNTFNSSIILSKEMDVDKDGNIESFIIYKKNDKTWLTVGYRLDGQIMFSPPIPAPMEGQEIIFNDYDKDGIVEFIVSGYKEDKLGYGVYKFFNFKIIDIFSEGMKECC
ncbi:MAG: Cys-Cys-COOH (seleno)protein SaoC [Fusobacteriaceae bacterium]